MIPRHERKKTDGHRFIAIFAFFTADIYIDRDYVTMGDEEITSRVFFSRKEAALEDANEGDREGQLIDPR